MVIVYAPKTTDRLKYILDEIFKYRLGLEWRIAEDKNDFTLAGDLHKINYSSENLGGFYIPNSGFLETEGVNTEFKPHFGRMDYQPVLFPMDGGLGFDVFSMAFWCLSRYEEYQPFKPDLHDRFCASQSVFNKNGFIEAPVLDIALQFFFEKAGLIAANKYATYPTLDIDIAYKYKGKGFVRSVLGFFKSLLYLDIGEVVNRVNVTLGKSDPWDTYTYILQALKSSALRTRIFIHVGALGTYDKAVPLSYPAFGATVKELAASFSMGVHPSYGYGQTGIGIENEKTKLQNFIGMPVNRSRQHFLRMTFPETYRNLIKAGIKHDYTMGFPDQIGFRAGTGHSFRFYDLLEEKTTELIVHPFCAMDVTLKNYMAFTPEIAKEKIGIVKNICKKYGVPFCFIFHNESLSETDEWVGWKEVFEKCLA